MDIPKQKNGPQLAGGSSPARAVAIDPRQFLSGYNKGRGESLDPKDIEKEIRDKFPGKHTCHDYLHVVRKYMVWTRSDGSRYKDFSYIEPGFFEGEVPGKDGVRYAEMSKVAMDELWGRICTKGKPILVSGEFGRSEMSEWVKAGGNIYSRVDNRKEGDGMKIMFGSASRLRNSAVWRSKEI